MQIYLFTKTVDNATPNVGDIVNFTITASNAGPNSVNDAQVVDILPSGYAYVSSNSTNYDDATGLWSINTLAVGANATLVIQAQVLGSGTYTNTATVSSPSVGDTDPTNDEDTSTPVPNPVAEVEIVKTISDPTPNVGSIVTFTLEVTNNGLSPATGVVVNDQLQSCYTFQSASSTNYNSGNGNWNVGTIAMGDSNINN